MPVRVRFAPSPTGFLHIGGLRTALFTYLVARNQGGAFILRIEDTDQKREVEGAADRLIDILEWTGIRFDEGPHAGGDYGPYIQTQRLHIYKEYADIALNKGFAYRCFCSPERLEEMRRDQQVKKLAPQYDRRCRDLPPDEIARRMSAGERFVIRQKMPLEGELVVNDTVRGEIRFQTSTLDDHVLVKSDGVPTYQFANVVDDHLMKISHVTRAEEWLPSFPKNVLLYQAFGWELPVFIHYPVILNKGGGKLSKRHGDVMVEDFRDKGYLPEALINFCVLLGWHPKGENEILSLADTEREFDIKGIGASAAIFDTEKLDYFNGYYIRKKPLDDLTRLCVPFLEQAGLLKDTGGDRFEIPGTGSVVDFAYVRNVISLEQERMKKLSDVPELAAIFFTGDLTYEPEMLIWKKMEKEDARRNLAGARGLLEGIPEAGWSKESIEQAVLGHIQAEGANVGFFMWPLRVALTGRKASPGAFEVAWALGKEESLRRVDRAIAALV